MYNGISLDRIFQRRTKRLKEHRRGTSLPTELESGRFLPARPEHSSGSRLYVQGKLSTARRQLRV